MKICNVVETCVKSVRNSSYTHRPTWVEKLEACAVEEEGEGRSLKTLSPARCHASGKDSCSCKDDDGDDRVIGLR